MASGGMESERIRSTKYSTTLKTGLTPVRIGFVNRSSGSCRKPHPTPLALGRAFVMPSPKMVAETSIPKVPRRAVWALVVEVAALVVPLNLDFAAKSHVTWHISRAGYFANELFVFVRWFQSIAHGNMRTNLPVAPLHLWGDGWVMLLWQIKTFVHIVPIGPVLFAAMPSATELAAQKPKGSAFRAAKSGGKTNGIDSGCETTHSSWCISPHLEHRHNKVP
ncbi:hypothetical protein ASPACDRAFT_40969 [Aspergillus aculeatus ATCC 16872]|uniref:Uncharacterized protein n=1 Tax=Aspergillus aculeatus (strain ATCC 16872 / CBS 172.66 / WB 5094) TaxID=690307 RepID=A0A1L9X0Y6_ASPA1|nr:uncharacterized protein ASPACDRAFT_40969 [Aspergillus aculeatus ATCC 16872]OJK02150.1 hypothetical protein ASPACDRAFT_40969 [Aspergillus aculeatus ATCC 16872]